MITIATRLSGKDRLHLFLLAFEAADPHDEIAIRGGKEEKSGQGALMISFGAHDCALTTDEARLAADVLQEALDKFGSAGTQGFKAMVRLLRETSAQVDAETIGSAKP